MDNPVTATFRVEKDIWNDFQDYAKGKGQTASALLKNFISLCLSGGADENHNLDTTINPAKIDPDVEIAIANAIRPLEDRVKSLEELLASIPDGFRYPDDVKDFV